VIIRNTRCFLPSSPPKLWLSCGCGSRSRGINSCDAVGGAGTVPRGRCSYPKGGEEPEKGAHRLVIALGDGVGLGGGVVAREKGS
jgi:hypothetical protein